MPTYIFVVTSQISMATAVTASSLKEAIAEAKRRSIKDLCKQCSCDTSEKEWSFSEVDADPATGDLVDLHQLHDSVDQDTFQEAESLWQEMI